MRKPPATPEACVTVLKTYEEPLDGRRFGGTPAAPEGERIETFDGMVGDSPAMVDVYRRILRVAPTDCTVLIQGETGTGKELVARSIHKRSRREGPFLGINVSAIPETLFEDQLFGHEAGAFTDARAGTPGWFEAASGGTLFLDEIGELSPSAQAKLLRVLDDRRFARLGSRRLLPVTARLLTATNRDLAGAVAAGEYRGDLYHRLTALTIRVPALRDRGDDVPRLLDYYRDLIESEIGGTAELSEAARRILTAYRWPGNVRELQNTLRGALLSAPGAVIDERDLPAEVRHGAPQSPCLPPCLPEGVTLRQAWLAFERQCIDQTLERCGGIREAAAKRLGIDSKTLRRKLMKANAFSAGRVRRPHDA